MTELIGRAAVHRGSSNDIFRDRMLHKALGGDDLNLALINILLIDHPFDAAEMVAVTVGIDHGHYGSDAELFIDQL